MGLLSTPRERSVEKSALPLWPSRQRPLLCLANVIHLKQPDTKPEYQNRRVVVLEMGNVRRGRGAWATGTERAGGSGRASLGGVGQPVRTCVGCRERADKAELLRVVWRGALVADERQVEPGRGAYLHRDRRCVEAAVRRRALGRALRLRGEDLGQIDTTELAAAFA